MKQDNWVARIVLALACVVGVIIVHQTDVGAWVASDTVMPANDGGVIIAPPRQRPSTAISCDGQQRAVIVQNPDDSDQNPSGLNVRVGSSRVKAFPAAKKNGIVLLPGQSITWDLSNGALYAVSEGASDAGVAMGVVCVKGGAP